MLISIEGLPGAGKSAQAALLAACLTRQAEVYRASIAAVTAATPVSTAPR